MYKSLYASLKVALLKDGFDVTLKTIDNDVISDWACNWAGQRKPPNGGWDWRIIKNKYRKRCKRVDFAIYSEDGTLEGLCMGRITRGRNVVRIDYLEGNPNPNPKLKRAIANIAVFAVSAIALSLNSRHVAIVNPVNSRVENIYKDLGFSYDRPYGRSVKNTMYKQIKSVAYRP